MKRIFCSAATGVIVAFVSASGFKNSKLGPFYFAVNDGVNKFSNSSAKFFDSQVTAIVGPLADGCSGFFYDCVVTFNSSQLTSGLKHLRPGFQQAQSTISTRGEE